MKTVLLVFGYIAIGWICFICLFVIAGLTLKYVLFPIFDNFLK